MLLEPLSTSDAKALARKALAQGVVRFTKHALDRMSERKLTETDVTNVIRAGATLPAESENGSWRYRFETPRIAVVVAFRAEDDAELADELNAEPGKMKTKLVVVTAMRI